MYTFAENLIALIVLAVLYLLLLALIFYVNKRVRKIEFNTRPGFKEKMIEYLFRNIIEDERTTGKQEEKK
jgi:uncharacterized protein YneF (UPF0154 family)